MALFKRESKLARAERLKNEADVLVNDTRKRLQGIERNLAQAHKATTAADNAIIAIKSANQKINPDNKPAIRLGETRLKDTENIRKDSAEAGAKLVRERRILQGALNNRKRTQADFTNQLKLEETIAKLRWT